MRTSSALKQIAKDRLRLAYWPSLVVVAIAFLENFADFLRSLFQLISGKRLFFMVWNYTDVPVRGFVPSNFISSFLTSVNWVFLLYSLAAPVLFVGCASYFLKLLRGQDSEIKDVIGHFSLFFRALWLSILVALIVGLVYFGFYLGGQFLSWIFRFGPGFQAVMMLVAVIPAIIISLSYSMVYFVLADNPNLTALQAMDESKKIIYGEKGSLFVLALSFIGWFLLDALLGGLLMIFIYPYMIATFTAFYIDITNPVQLSVAE